MSNIVYIRKHVFQVTHLIDETPPGFYFEMEDGEPIGPFQTKEDAEIAYDLNKV